MPTTLQSADAKRAFSDATKTQALECPVRVGDTIIPIVDITPRKNRIVNLIKNATASNATSATVYSVPTTQDFYLTGFHCSYIKDATSTATSCGINFTEAETGLVIYYNFGCFTLTANSGTMERDFTFPIRVKRGTNILVVASTNVANIQVQATIQGYLVPEL